LFGVFDGHGGAEASAFCARKLPGMLAAEWDGAAAEKSFVTTFVAADRKYMDKNNDDGTTALMAVVDPGARRLHVANAGDSRAVLISADGKATELSTDHKPANAAERKRIEKASFEVRVDTVVLHGKRVKARESFFLFQFSFVSL
jgi:serine/threonine protein phosphatase PrpC